MLDRKTECRSTLLVAARAVSSYLLTVSRRVRGKRRAHEDNEDSDSFKVHRRELNRRTLRGQIRRTMGPEVNHVPLADHVSAKTVSSIPVAYEPQSCTVTIRKGRTETESDSLALRLTQCLHGTPGGAEVRNVRTTNWSNAAESASSSQRS